MIYCFGPKPSYASGDRGYREVGHPYPGLQVAVHVVFTVTVPFEQFLFHTWTLAAAGGAKQPAATIASPLSNNNALMTNLNSLLTLQANDRVLAFHDIQ